MTIEVPGAGCASCSLGIRKALEGAGNVSHLAEGAPRNRIVVSYEPADGRPTVYIQALRAAGFKNAHLVGGS